MKITVKQLMQLKNELGNMIMENLHMRVAGRGYSNHGGIAYGATFRNEKLVEEQLNSTEFPAYYEETRNLLRLSEKVHDALAQANYALGVPSLVRRRENVKSLLKILETALEQSKEYIKVDVVNLLGTGAQEVTTRYIPFMTSQDLKTRIREMKRLARELQTQIDAANNEELEFPELDQETIEQILDG